MLLSRKLESLLSEFVPATIESWIDAGLIKRNNYGVELRVAKAPGGNLAEADLYHYGFSVEGGNHDVEWYQKNAHGKILACLVTGRDSHEAVRLYQGVLANYEGIFPWGGAVIDQAYGIVVGTSGGKEDEDILVSRTIRNFLVMHLDRLGQAQLDDAHTRGEQEGEAGADRFTRIPAVELPSESKHPVTPAMLRN